MIGGKGAPPLKGFQLIKSGPGPKKTGKGAGPATAPVGPPSKRGIDPPGQCNSCEDSGVRVSTSHLLHVTIYSSEDPNTPLYVGQHYCNDSFRFFSANMPYCLTVKIRKIGASVKDVQTITFEPSCCNVGASYGFLEILNID